MIVKKAWDYPYSGAKDHMKERKKQPIPIATLQGVKEGKNWKEYLQEEDETMTKEIRLKTSRGLVIGTDKFIKNLEGLLNRNLKCLKWGSPLFRGQLP